MMKQFEFIINKDLEVPEFKIVPEDKIFSRKPKIIIKVPVTYSRSCKAELKLEIKFDDDVLTEVEVLKLKELFNSNIPELIKDYAKSYETEFLKGIILSSLHFIFGPKYKLIFFDLITTKLSCGKWAKS